MTISETIKAIGAGDAEPRKLLRMATDLLEPLYGWVRFHHGKTKPSLNEVMESVGAAIKHPVDSECTRVLVRLMIDSHPRTHPGRSDALVETMTKFASAGRFNPVVVWMACSTILSYQREPITVADFMAACESAKDELHKIREDPRWLPCAKT